MLSGTMQKRSEKIVGCETVVMVVSPLVKDSWKGRWLREDIQQVDRRASSCLSRSLVCKISMTVVAKFVVSRHSTVP